MLSKIRGMLYSFKTRQKRTELYRKKGSTDYINLPRTKLLDPNYVFRTLKFAGLSENDINRFILDNSN